MTKLAFNTATEALLVVMLTVGLILILFVPIKAHSQPQEITKYAELEREDKLEYLYSRLYYLETRYMTDCMKKRQVVECWNTRVKLHTIYDKELVKLQD